MLLDKNCHSETRPVSVRRCSHTSPRRRRSGLPGAVGLLLLVICSGSIHADEEQKTGLPENPYAHDGLLSCGPRCVSFLFNAYDKDIHYAQVLKECPPGPMGTTLKQAKDCLENHGLHTRGVQGVTTEAIKSLNVPIMLHLQNDKGSGHFIVVYGWNEDDQTFQIYSPPRRFGTGTEEEVAAYLTGIGLVVCDQPLPPVSELTSRRLSESRLGLSLCFGVLCLVFGIRGLRRTYRSNNDSGTPSSSGTGVTTACLAACLCLPFAGCADTVVGDNATVEATESEDGRTVHRGRIVAGPTMVHTFRIQNDSGSSFRIKKVRKSCSCQKAEYSREKIVEPGEYAVLTVEVPTKGREGRIEYNFDMDTDSEHEDWKTIPLHLHAELDTRIRAVPSQVSFGRIDAGSGASTRLTVTAIDGNVDQKLISAELIQKESVVELTRVTEDVAFGTVQFDVDVESGAAIGDLNAKVLLKFDDDYIKELEVPVFGRVEGSIQTTPRLVVVKKSSHTDTVVRLAAKDGQTFAVSGVDADNDHISIEPRSDGSSGEHRYVVDVSDDIKPGYYKVQFDTNRKDQPTVSVPVLVRL